VRLSLKLGLLLVSVVTLSVTWNGVGGASLQTRLMTATQSAGQSSVPVSGFSGDEVFCAEQPLSGTLSYHVSSGRASVRVAIHHFPRSTLVGIEWSTNAAHGYLIGTVRSDGIGGSVPGSERLFRPAEARGYKVVLTWTNNDSGQPCGLVVHPQLRPCSANGQWQPTSLSPQPHWKRACPDN